MSLFFVLQTSEKNWPVNSGNLLNVFLFEWITNDQAMSLNQDKLENIRLLKIYIVMNTVNIHLFTFFI